jgi:4-amino-4-deoxy-L-arabinose transferase-like glycosyltransferase
VTLLRRHLPLILLIFLLGAAFRVAAWGRDSRFHPDEALYATYARIMIRYGDYLLGHKPLDKPPLGIAAVAWSYGVFAPSQAAPDFRLAEHVARFSTLCFSLLHMAAFYALIRRMWGAQTALVGAFLWALCPYEVAFSGTIFHDPLLTLCCMLCALQAARDRFGWAGLWAACALWTKQSAVQFLPFYGLLGVAIWWGAGRPWPLLIRKLALFTVVCSGGALLLALWSMARAAQIDYWTLGVTNPGALRLINAEEIAPRLTAWWGMFTWLLGPPWAWLLAGLAVVFAFGKPHAEFATLICGVLIVASMAAYWLLAFNTYDRYLLPLAPVSIALLARGVHIMGRWFKPASATAALTLAVGVFMWPYAALAAADQAAVGGDRGAHQGIESLAAQINQLPPAAVIYDHWLDWALGFYLGENRHVQVIYMASPAKLSTMLCQDQIAGYLAAPKVRVTPWLAAMRQIGASLKTLYDDHRFVLIQMVCPWP